MQGAFTMQHFDQDLNFHATEEDPVTKMVCLELSPFCYVQFGLFEFFIYCASVCRQ